MVRELHCHFCCHRTNLLSSSRPTPPQSSSACSARLLRYAVMISVFPASVFRFSASVVTVVASLRAAASPPEWYPERSSTLLIPSLDVLEMWSGVLHRNDIVEDARCRVVSASEATHLSALLETPAAVTAFPYDESDGSSCRAEQLSCLARNSDPALQPYPGHFPADSDVIRRHILSESETL